MRALLAGVIVLLASACSTSEDPGAASKRACSELQEHVIDLRLADASGVDREAHRKAMQRALGDRFVATCTTKLSAREVQCARAAKDSAGLRSCSQEGMQ